jgi:hypothetical protein
VRREIFQFQRKKGRSVGRSSRTGHHAGEAEGPECKLRLTSSAPLQRYDRWVGRSVDDGNDDVKCYRGTGREA